jgi:excisionase family DNA binding protein
MNNEVVSEYNEYLKLTGGDKAAAASLTLAAAMKQSHGEAPALPATAMTVAEVAARLRINRKSLYAMCRDRRVRCYRAGRLARIPVEEVERIEKESGARDPAPRFPDIIKRYY